MTNLQNETFWLVLRWWQDESEVEHLLSDPLCTHQKYSSLAQAEDALAEEWMDGYDKGCEGKLIEIKATYSWKSVGEE